MKNQEEMWLLTEKYEGMESEAFHADCARLKAGEPLAYLIGSIPFLGCIIHLDSHPLITRPETEFWVEKGIESIRQYVRTYERTDVRILDLCAGSGCIGVAVAKAIPEAQVDFVEIDGTHHDTIQKNIAENNINPSHTRIYGGDLFTNITVGHRMSNSYDYILTNPPYIDPEIDRAEESVKEHEPHLALYGGKNGMECIAQIIKQAPPYLIPNGTLYIEHEPEQSKAIQELAEENNFSTTTHVDQYNIERYSVLILQNSVNVAQ